MSESEWDKGLREYKNQNRHPLVEGALAEGVREIANGIAYLVYLAGPESSYAKTLSRQVQEAADSLKPTPPTSSSYHTTGSDVDLEGPESGKMDTSKAQGWVRNSIELAIYTERARILKLLDDESLLEDIALQAGIKIHQGIKFKSESECDKVVTANKIGVKTTLSIIKQRIGEG